MFGISLLLRIMATTYIAQNTAVWDVGPFAFIAKEAGAVVTSFDGSRLDYCKRKMIRDFIIAPNIEYTEYILKAANLL